LDVDHPSDVITAPSERAVDISRGYYVVTERAGMNEKKVGSDFGRLRKDDDGEQDRKEYVHEGRMERNNDSWVPIYRLVGSKG
jgi:hypothetical protein